MLNINPTIKDVAKLANTSKSTVSRYLNGHPVKKKTEESLKKAIRELNFYPNVNARRLVLNRTQVIGIVVDNIANSYYSGILRGIEYVARQKGYSCIFYSWDLHQKKESDFLGLLHEGQVDGLILLSFMKRDPLDLLRIGDTSYPVVLIGDNEGMENIHSVDVDNFSGVADVVAYLHDLGHQKIAYISGPDNIAATHYRFQGYKEMLEVLNLEYKPSWIVVAPTWSNEGGYMAMEKLLDTGGFTAVVASNDETAIGALSAAHERGLHVPEDYSIVGFDDINVSSWVYPTLTTVRQPFYQIGLRAAERLFERIGDYESVVDSRDVLKPEIIIRNSVKEFLKYECKN